MEPPVDTEALISSHVPWVYRTVGELTARIPRHVDRDELISAGLLALVLSANAYEQDRGVPFMRFAKARLQGALLDELRALDGATRSARQRFRRVNTAREELSALLGRTPGTAELAAYLDIAVCEMETAAYQVHLASAVRLEEFTSETVANLLRDHAPGPEELVLHDEVVRCLHDAIGQLPSRSRRIIVGSFFHGRRMTDIAAELSISGARVSQLRTAALDQLRASMRARLDSDSATTAINALAPAPQRNCGHPYPATISPSDPARSASAPATVADDRARQPVGRG